MNEISLRLAAFLVAASSLLAQPAAVRFAAVESAGGLVAPSREALIACGDFDDDGDPDILLDGRRLFRNDSDEAGIRFTDVTKACGLEGAVGPHACWVDFDLDGKLDIASASGEVWVQGEDGGFTNVRERLELHLPHGSASAIAWGDLDGDGFADLFAGGNNSYNPNRHYDRSCWLNPAPKKALAKLSEREWSRLSPMREVGADFGLKKPMYGRSIVFCDFDEDGDQDVYSGNYHLKANDLFVNEEGRLVERGAEYGVQGRRDPEMFTVPGTNQKIGYRYGHTIGVTWGDWNNDGYFDLWVANLVHKYAGPATEGYARATGQKIDPRGWICDDSNLFVNQGPPHFHFVDERARRGIPTRPIGGRGVFRGDELWSNAICADLNLDGTLDVFCNQIYGHLSYSFGVLYLNGNGTFSEHHEAAGVKIWGGYGSAFADLDSDGRPDLIVCGAAAPKAPAAAHVFRNVSDERPWIGLDLERRAGVQTLGTKVWLHLDDSVQVRQVQSTMGSHSQGGDPRVHFGLGASEASPRVLVLWPDGMLQEVRKPRPGRYQKVSRARGRKPRLSLRGPEAVSVGEEVTFTVRGAPRRSTCSWDLGGSRAFEKVGEEPTCTWRFEEPGRHLVTVFVTRPGRPGAWARHEVEVAPR